MEFHVTGACRGPHFSTFKKYHVVSGHNGKALWEQNRDHFFHLIHMQNLLRCAVFVTHALRPQPCGLKRGTPSPGV